MLNSDETDKITAQAIFAEYSALRAEIHQRISIQESAVRGSLALTGGLIVLLLSKTILGLNAEALLQMITGVPGPSVDVLFVLFCGYLLGLELIAGHSIYQVYAMFRISNYMSTLDQRLRKMASSRDIQFFTWDVDSSGLKDTRPQDPASQPWYLKVAINCGACLQPLSLHILILIGLIVLGLNFRTIVVGGLYSYSIRIVCGAAVGLLALFWIGLLMIYFGLHKWLISRNELVQHRIVQPIKI